MALIKIPITGNSPKSPSSSSVPSSSRIRLATIGGNSGLRFGARPQSRNAITSQDGDAVLAILAASASKDPEYFVQKIEQRRENREAFYKGDNYLADNIRPVLAAVRSSQEKPGTKGEIEPYIAFAAARLNVSSFLIAQATKAVDEAADKPAAGKLIDDDGNEITVVQQVINWCAPLVPSETMVLATHDGSNRGRLELINKAGGDDDTELRTDIDDLRKLIEANKVLAEKNGEMLKKQHDSLIKHVSESIPPAHGSDGELIKEPSAGATRKRSSKSANTKKKTG